MIYISKMLVCSLFAIIIPFLYVILGLIVNLAFNGFNNIKLADVLITIKIVCAQLPIYIGFVGLMVLVGVVFKVIRQQQFFRFCINLLYYLFLLLQVILIYQQLIQ